MDVAAGTCRESLQGVNPLKRSTTKVLISLPSSDLLLGLSHGRTQLDTRGPRSPRGGSDRLSLPSGEQGEDGCISMGRLKASSTASFFLEGSARRQLQQGQSCTLDHWGPGGLTQLEDPKLCGVLGPHACAPVLLRDVITVTDQ